MKRKNLALRMSACMMSALLVVGSAAPAYAAEDVVFADQAETTDSEAEVAPAEDTVSEEAVEETEAAGDELDVQSDDVDLEAGDAEELSADEFSDEADSSAAVFADEAAETQTGFGTANTELAAGTYQVTVGLKNANDITSDSMAGSCIAGKGTLVVAADGSAKLTVPIQAATVRGQTAYAKDWKVYKSDLNSETTDAEFTVDTDGNVDSITFTIPDKTQDGVYVSMYIDLMDMTQSAYMSVDYANAEKDQTVVDTSALEAAIAQADALDEMSYTKASWDENKEAIDTANAAAKEALEKKESQETVDNARLDLTDVLEKLVLAGDPTELQAVIDQAKALNETDYTGKTVTAYWSKIQDGIAEGEKAIAERESDATFNQISSSLSRNMGSLVKAANSEKLEKLVKEAEALNQEDYTADSWNKSGISGALTQAKSILNERGTKDDIRTACDRLEDAIDALVPVSTSVTVGRGNYEKKLAPGTYSLPVELLNGGHADATNQYTSSDYMSHTSMAAGCFTGDATLVIHEDGTATMTVGVQAITALGMTGAASEWSIYENTQAYLDGEANSTTGARYNAHVDESKVQAGKRKPSKISFTVPDLKQNVVATHMYIEVMTVYQDACIGLDWANVKKVSDETSATSTVEKDYVVNADALTQLKNLKEGKTVKLDQDVTLSEDLTIKGGTIDLNGHTLSQEDNLLVIKGNVEIIDNSTGRNGKITSKKYSEDSDTQTSISVQKGSLHLNGISVDGQIGNKIHTDNSANNQNIPYVSVKIENCKLTSTEGYNNISFGYAQNGVNVIVENSQLDNGIIVNRGNGEKTSISQTTMKSLNLSGDSAVVRFATVTGKATIETEEKTIDNSNFGGLTIGGSGNVTLENSNSTLSSSSDRTGALTVTGTGTVTVKGGTFENTNKRGYAVVSRGYPVRLEGGYFKGGKATVNGAYTTPEGKILGDVTEGEHAGYQTVIDGTAPEVTEPAATIYNSDGTVARKISEEEITLLLSYATNGQTVKLDKDLVAENITSYRDIIFDLNGHTITVGDSSNEGLIGATGCCRVIDSSAEKNGKLVAVGSLFAAKSNTAQLILDNITCEVNGGIQGISVGSAKIINGTKVSGAYVINAGMGGGITHVEDSFWTIPEKDYRGNDVDADALLKGSVRTSQYTITNTGDRSFTVTVNELGKAMRAFEALNVSAYTKASYAAAKAVYDEIDGSADEDIQGDVIAQKAKELNDAVAKLQAPATAKSVSALKSAVTAGKKLKSTDYTASTFKAFTTALTSAEKVLNNVDHSEAQVTAATKSLAAAKAKLVKKNVQTITVSVKNSKGVVSKKYGDKAFYLGARAKGGLTYKSSNTKIATVDSKGKVTIKAAGTVKITITAKATSTYKAATKVVTVKAAKAAPSIKTKVGSKTFTYATVKKKAQVFTLGTSVNSKGKLTYKKLSGTSAIAVSSTGKFTVKKGLKKGTYRVKVKISAAARGNYNAGSRTVTITVKVK